MVFLENSHRFKNNSEWGQLLSRFRVGKYTEEDIEIINTRWLGGYKKVAFPSTKDSLDTCYACSTNKEQNAIGMSLFEYHLKNTHTNFSNEEIKPPHHTILIQSVILSGKDKKEIPQNMHNYIIIHVVTIIYRQVNIKR